MKYMRLKVFIFLSVFFLFVLISPVDAATLRVPQDHSSIPAALSAAANGDVILVSPGTYNGGFTINKTITLASLYQTTKDESYIKNTILSGGAAVITTSSPAGADTTITGFTIQGGTDGIKANTKFILDHCTVTGASSDGIDFTNSGGVVRFSTFENMGDDGIDMDGATEALIENNIIQNNGQDGIENRLHPYSNPSKPLNIIIRNNIIRGNPQDGIQLIWYNQKTDRIYRIEHNLFDGNKRVGIGLMDQQVTNEDYRAANITEPIYVYNNTFTSNNYGLTGGDNLIALNNIFTKNTTMGMKNVDGGSKAAYNLFFGNGTNYIGSNVEASTNKLVDPLLNVAFELNSGSPAIDAGVKSYSHNGVEIINFAYSGSAPDLGWKETGGIVNNTPTPTVAQGIPTPTPTASGSCPRKADGDASCDGKVDLADFEIFRKEYLSLLTTKTADFNSDGKVNLIDFEVWRRTFTGSQPTGMPTATPTSTGPTFTPTPTIKNTACTFTISSNQTQIDGKGNYAQVKPGDVLCLPTGTRPPLSIINLNGTANAPIVIRNGGGIVKITGAGNQRGISVRASNYVRITGTGVSENCGYKFTPEQNNCGIDISGVGDGIEIADTLPMGHIEVDHIYMHDTDHSKWDSGVALKPQNGVTLSYFFFHHNIIANTDHEGMYIGADPNKPLADNGKLEHVEVSHNLVKHTGFDGINIKQAKIGNKVHHNVVIDTGFLTGQVQHIPEGGIQLADTYADVYNNFVLNSFDTGINMGRPSGGGQSRYFNNIIVNSKNVGIDLNEDGTMVYNNTVVNSGADGIRATGTGVQIFDNAVVGSKTTPIRGASSGISNNYTGALEGAGFENPQANDFSLKQTSPLVDVGRNTGVFPGFDYLDVSRPQGVKTDIGAYEYK